MAVKIYNVYTKGMRISDGVFTAPALITDAGLYIASAGGYYAGGNILVDGKEYAIIIAPKELGESSGLQWKTSQTATSGATSTFDGKSNMDAIIAAGLSNHPAAQFCANLDINGFNDWHLPSPDEQEVCYRFLKPTTQDNHTEIRLLHDAVNGTNPNSNPIGTGYTTSDPSQTSVAEFQSGGSQEFVTSPYWASMEQSSTHSRMQSFFNGGQSYDVKTVSSYLTRAVRWVEV